MSVTASLYQHTDFGGESVSADSGAGRYYWTRYGSAHNDYFSSARAWSHGNRGHVYCFEHIDFSGRFAALNVGGAYSSAWWSYFGDAFNDEVSSSLIVAREPAAKEREVALRGIVLPQFISLFDAKTAGKPVSRDGDPRMYATIFPDYDRDFVFATIAQDLTVTVRIPIKTTIWNPFGADFEIDLGEVRWSDYAAKVRYDIRFSVSGDGKLHGWAAWSHVWVESGVFSGRVHGDLAPGLHDAKSDLTSAIESGLGLLNARGKFADVYLLPGGVPDMNAAGAMGRYDDDVTVVAVAR
jgi:hypothetical protein